MSLRMARDAFSILLPRTESPTMRAACRTSFSTSSRRWMQRTTVPSWTSVSWAISANGWDEGTAGGRTPQRTRYGEMVYDATQAGEETRQYSLAGRIPIMHSRVGVEPPPSSSNSQSLSKSSLQLAARPLDLDEFEGAHFVIQTEIACKRQLHQQNSEPSPCLWPSSRPPPSGQT